jgi:hypothetical protein
MWIFGYPIVIFLLLIKNKSNLNSDDTLIKYGLFYVGFKDSTFYWQIIIINLKKVFFIIITISLQSSNKVIFVRLAHNV